MIKPHAARVIPVLFASTNAELQLCTLEDETGFCARELRRCARQPSSRADNSGCRQSSEVQRPVETRARIPSKCRDSAQQHECHSFRAARVVGEEQTEMAWKGRPPELIRLHSALTGAPETEHKRGMGDVDREEEEEEEEKHEKLEVEGGEEAGSENNGDSPEVMPCLAPQIRNASTSDTNVLSSSRSASVSVYMSSSEGDRRRQDGSDNCGFICNAWQLFIEGRNERRGFVHRSRRERANGSGERESEEDQDPAHV